MTKADFAPVVEACKQFLELFTCSNPSCDGWVYVLGIREGKRSSAAHVGL